MLKTVCQASDVSASGHVLQPLRVSTKSSRMQITKSLYNMRGPAVLGLLLASSLFASAQQSFTWDQIKTRFEAANPTLKADAINVQEMQAEEITAYLRPNPGLTVSTDGTQIAPNNGIWQPLTGTQVQANFSYLHQRDHKRELRLETAKEE